MSIPAFAVRVLPLYAVALVLTGVGAMPLGDHIPSAWLLPLAILALLAFAALMTFRRVRTWPTLLLLTLALVAGGLLRLMLPEMRPDWPWALAAGVGIPLVGVPLGWKAGPRLASVGWGTWAAAWVYILGWVGWQLLGLGQTMRPYWGIAGLIVFSALTITWASSLAARRPEETEGSVASELYLIGLNLGVAALVVAGA